MTNLSNETHIINWQDLVIEVRYQPNWLGEGGGYAIAHLDITCITPSRHPLPFTETGYRSRFLHHEEVDEAGGAVAYVTAWLDEASKSRVWSDLKSRNRQLTLF